MKLISWIVIFKSNAIKKDGVSLNAKQSKKLKELMSISNIKYGY